MAHTNATENYGLPQWIGTDKPTFLGDFNTAFGTIDTQMKANSDAATNAVSTANTADSNATNALANANTALSTANSAASTANDATVIANQAKTQSTTAAADAESALTASAANTITNLAPAYDSTRTYSVGEYVTYVDENNSGKLYKCIVAVATPMEFNINYWDDVTVSSQLGWNLISTSEADGTKTYAEVLRALASDTFDTEFDYMLIQYVSADNGYNYIPISGFSTSFLEFNVIKAYASDTLVFRYYISSSQSLFQKITFTYSGPNIAYTNESATVPNSGDYFKLYARKRTI